MRRLLNPAILLNLCSATLNSAQTCTAIYRTMERLPPGPAQLRSYTGAPIDGYFTKQANRFAYSFVRLTLLLSPLTAAGSIARRLRPPGIWTLEGRHQALLSSKTLVLVVMIRFMALQQNWCWYRFAGENLDLLMICVKQPITCSSSVRSTSFSPG